MYFESEYHEDYFEEIMLLTSLIGRIFVYRFA